jgi:hypothetical protein
MREYKRYKTGIGDYIGYYENGRFKGIYQDFNKDNTICAIDTNINQVIHGPKIRFEYERV